MVESYLGRHERTWNHNTWIVLNGEDIGQVDTKDTQNTSSSERDSFYELQQFIILSRVDEDGQEDDQY